jgi:hypothetical protein
MPEQLATISPQTNSILETFVYEQLALVKRQSIRESSFLEIIFCVFAHGAAQQLRKQTQQKTEVSQKDLIRLIKKICRVGDIKAQELIDSVASLGKKYYLIENIIEQGEQAADEWLNCETKNDNRLKDLLDKYKNATMFDLGIDGINPEHESQQKYLYHAIDDTVSEIRKRSLKYLAFSIVIVALAGLVINYFGLYSY